MVRISVSSSNIRSVGYVGNVLEVEFHSGDIWQYHDVPLDVYNALVSASSIGSYFHAYIRDAYRQTQIR